MPLFVWLEVVIMKSLEKILASKIVNTGALSSGLNTVFKADLVDGSSVFIKQQKTANDLFIKEGKELSLLGQFINTPKVIYADEFYLVLEYLSASGSGLNQLDLGEQLAKLHQQKQHFFGFDFDNKIGTTPQYNAVNKKIANWREFYWDYRLLLQINLAKQNNLLSSDVANKLLSLKSTLKDLLPIDISPVLLHGDLWSGNALAVANKAYFIDPACYYGHNEADLALTYMFGGFGADFYSAYHKQHPPTNGFDKRKYLYMLYHYLNHLNLFGSSYLGGVKQCLTALF